MPKDPICGMDVDINTDLKVTKDGSQYYFCSLNCKNKFLDQKTGTTESNIKKEPTNSTKETIPISGMNCASCAISIENNLKKEKGIQSASVNYASGKAYVEYNPSLLSGEHINQIIEKSGYNVIKEPSTSGNLKLLNLKIIGMDNPHCLGTIKGVLDSLDGIISKELFINEKAHIVYDPTKIESQKIKDAIESAGYSSIEEKQATADREQAIREKESKSLKIKFLISSLLALPLLYFSMGPHIKMPMPNFSRQLLALIQLMLTTPIIIAGYQFYTKGILTFIKTKTANMDTLVAIGTGSAYSYSLFITFFIFKGGIEYGAHDLYYEVAGLLIAFILLGKWLESIAKGKTSSAIKKLIALQPKTAIVLRNNQEQEIALEDVVLGDIVIVKPGQKIPVDGKIIDGYSNVDESMITGESMPTEKKKGSEVIGGTINTTGTFTFKATKVGKDTALAQIIKLVEEAQGSKAPVQELADKISAYFVPIVVIIALLSFLIWLIAGQTFTFALSTLIAVLIISCPCALGLATPTAVMVATGLAAEHGILIKNALSIQLAEKIDTIVFDKTGTLTQGKPKVTNIEIIQSKNISEFLTFVASVENRSEHPIAKAILDYAREKNIQPENITNFLASEGKGIKAQIGSRTVFVGKKDFLIEQKIMLDKNLEKKADEFYNEGKTLIWVSENGMHTGIIAVADTIKESSIEGITKLKNLGISIMMITGDNKKTAQAIGKQIGIENIIAEVLPQDKANKIKELKNTGLKVAMVGDGINDAPALAAADLGIAIGSGTDIAIESADMVLIKNDISDVVSAITLSKYTMKKIKQNLFWAFFYNSIGIPIAAGLLYPFTGFLLNPIIAGIAMSFSSVSVISNSLLIKNYRKP